MSKRTETIEKAELQARIDSGEIKDVETLVALILSKGWTMKRVSKLSPDGRHQIGVRIYKGNVFRVKLDFDPSRANVPRGTSDFAQKPQHVLTHRPTRTRIGFLPGEEALRENSNRPFWIYGLVATNGYRYACYVGQTVRLLRRLHEHAARSRNGRSSSALFEWADRHDADVEVIVLDLHLGKRGDPIAGRTALELEGKWLWLAQTANIETPLSENWGWRLPKPSSDCVEEWPSEEIKRSALPINVVLENRPHVVEFSLGSIKAHII
ncbi:hypothetical protein HKCCE4037_11900 [Rhodobacterales bacterium HKCCE4037]|nr:hypothetical protein [Rhodobacterales bacterium HKCCE4037]